MGIDVIPRLPYGAKLALEAPPSLLGPAIVGKPVDADLREFACVPRAVSVSGP